MVLVGSPTYYSSRASQGQGNAQAPTSRPLVLYPSLFPLEMGRGPQSRETALSVLVPHPFIPVFSSEPVVLREYPRPQARGRFHGRFNRRCQEDREETLAFQSLPALLAAPKDSAVQSRRTAVSSATAVRATSIRPTSNQTCARAARSVCLPGRPMHVGGRGLNRIDRRLPLFGGSRPASPGALFTPSMACVAVRPRRGVGHVL